MRRRVLLGAMFGTMAGMAAAMGLHTLLTAQPELAAGPLGQALATMAAPGARLIALISPHAGMGELGILSHWLSLQLTLVLLGALTGLIAGGIVQFHSARTPDTPPPG